MKSAPLNLSKCKQKQNSLLWLTSSNLTRFKTVHVKKTTLNLGAKMFYLGIFGIKFEKTIVASKIGSLEYVYMQNVKEKEGRLTVGPNMLPMVI